MIYITEVAIIALYHNFFMLYTQYSVYNQPRL